MSNLNFFCLYMTSIVKKRSLGARTFILLTCLFGDANWNYNIKYIDALSLNGSWHSRGKIFEWLLKYYDKKGEPVEMIQIGIEASLTFRDF